MYFVCVGDATCALLLTGNERSMDRQTWSELEEIDTFY